MPKRFDVFLSHNSKDKPAVRELAEALRARGLEVWLDEWCLLPGQRWQEELEKVLLMVRAGAVVVGKDGFGPWEDQEMRVLLSQAVERRIPLVPVFLPGAPQQPKLPLFLKELVWSDLRDGLAPKALDRLADGISLPKEQTDLLDLYRVWAAERYNGLSLIGLGGGDLGRLGFEEVYVPLRIVRRREAMEALGALEKRPEPPRDDLGIESLFSTPDASNPHALLLGDPGSGKTTGLLKLLHLCLRLGGPPRSLGLPDGILPIFLRLRRFTAEDLDRPFEDFLQRELERELGEVAKGKIPADLGARLWQHGPLLLLLDGLDEIAEESLRARVCQLLDNWELSHRPQLRAVLSCRFAGYSARVRLGERFTPLEVRPLDAEQCRTLVRHWFRAAQRALPDRLSKQGALQATERLIAALDSPGYGSQRWKVLVGSPLLLTLLCVISYRGGRGGQMPRHRTAFYDQCLRVLLGPWRRQEDLAAPPADPPLDVETALAVLRSVAWELHQRQTWDDLSVAELSVLLRECLAPRGRQVSARLVLDWLHRDAGVLTDFGDHRYGLLHLGLQEYLAACHIARQGSSLLEEVCAHAGEEWWQEVFLLLAGLPGHGIFGPLLEGLLRSGALLGQADLIRACLEEAAEPDLTPFLAVLAPAEAPERQATVLRLLRGRNDPRLEAPVRALLDSAHPDVQALARQMAESFAAQPAGPGAREGNVFVLHAPEDHIAAVALAQALRSRGWQALAAAEDSSWRSDPERLVQEARGVVVPTLGSKAPWEERELLNVLKLFAGSGCSLVIAELSAEAGRAAPPRFLSTASHVDLRGGLTQSGLEALDHALTGVPATPVEAAASAATPEVLVEPLTRIRFLWIPGGQFQMGSKRALNAEPVHPVRITPFWLGETPVTNAQYAVYLEKTTRATEPEYWRDRRFSAPDQPVVGVSWEDAQVFCSWLGKTWGQQVLLPSEAQWEFAACGTDGREYPWGNEEPDATRACFGLDWEKDQPAPVGSYPAGRGPFGTFDQAGNVWEWCRDAWDEEAYAKRAASVEESLDPFVEGDKDSIRSLRGGGWDYPEQDLRAAFRFRLPAGSRVGFIGFRVAAAPASASPPSPLPSPSLPPGEGRRHPKT